jgi:hypothetical protein
MQINKKKTNAVGKDSKKEKASLEVWEELLRVGIIYSKHAEITKFNSI